MPIRTESRFIEISGNIIFGGSRTEKGEPSWHRQAAGGKRARQGVGRCRLAREGGREGGDSSRFHRDNAVISCPGTGNWLHVRGGGSQHRLFVRSRSRDITTLPRANFSVTKLMATSDENYPFFSAHSPAPANSIIHYIVDRHRGLIRRRLTFCTSLRLRRRN